MIDITEKDIVERRAVAEGKINLKRSTIQQIRDLKIKKGDVLTVARVAGIDAVKNTPSLIPFCHQIPIEFADVTFDVGDTWIKCRCEVKAIYKTGVEMESLSGVMGSLLTIWDMVKYLEKDSTGNYPETGISEIRVIQKVKGQK